MLIKFSLFHNLFRKQNQLWQDGLEYYKRTGSNKAPPCEYGIYSIKQRELNKSSTINVKTVSNATQTYDEVNDNETNIKSMKLKERVRKISQKVDSIKLNDNNKTTPSTITATTMATRNRNQCQRDENKNTVKPVTIKSSTITTSKVIYPSTSLTNDNNNNQNNIINNDKNDVLMRKLEKNSGQTQGDTLNQIKAMRRQRQTRLSQNVYSIGT